MKKHGANNSFEHLVVVHSPNSTRAGLYGTITRPQLEAYAHRHDAALSEVPIEDLPFGDAVDKVTSVINDRAKTAVIAAGGDGLASVTVNAVFRNPSDATLGFLPLGNACDIANSLSGTNDPNSLLSAAAIDYTPMKVHINDELTRVAVQYASFGVTSKMTEAINRPDMRKLRAKLKSPLLFGLYYWATRYTSELKPVFSQGILPPFRVGDSNDYSHDNNLAFMIGALGRSVRPRGGYLGQTEKFLVHSSRLSGHAGYDFCHFSIPWLLLGLGGNPATSETVHFDKPCQVSGQIDGEVVELDNVSKISVDRKGSAALSILSPKLTRRKNSELT